MTKKIAFIYFLLFSLLSCTNSQNSGITKKDMDKLLEQELKNQDRAKYGGKLKDIVIITDSVKVTRIVNIIAPKIKKRDELEKAKADKSLAERYITGDNTVVPEIIQILKGKDKSKRNDIYTGLNQYHDGMDNFTIKDPGLIRLILDKTNDKEDQEQAIDVAGSFKLPGILEICEQKLFSNSLPNDTKVLFWLAYDGKSKRTFDYLVAKIRTGKIEEKDLWHYYSDLSQFAKNGDAQIRKEAFDLCISLYNKHTLPQKYFEELNDYAYSSGNPAEFLLECIFNYGDESALPIMNEYVKKKVRFEEALCGLIRLEGNKHRKLVYSILDNQNDYFNGLGPAIKLFKITKDKTICDKVLVSFQHNKKIEDYMITRLLETLAAMDSNYIVQYNKNLINKELAERIEKAYQLTKITREDVLKDMVDLHLIDEPKRDAIRAKIKTSKEKSGYVYEILTHSDMYITFDTETDMVPVDYDKLITNFVGISNGKLNGLLVWLDAIEKPNNTYAYKITVVFNHKVYVAQPEDIGDWYDITVVSNLLNKVLFDAGIEERFINLESGDQTAQYLFGKDAAIKIFRNKYHLL